jgi:hypothetical protein
VLVVLWSVRRWFGAVLNTLIRPLLGLVSGSVHGSLDADADALIDQERLEKDDAERAAFGLLMIDEYKAKFVLAKTLDDLDKAAAELTPEVKKKMAAADVSTLREAYQEREATLARAGSVRSVAKKGKAATPALTEPPQPTPEHTAEAASFRATASVFSLASFLAVSTRA